MEISLTKVGLAGVKMPPLHSAEFIRSLLDFGADPFTADNDGHIVGFFEAFAGHPKTIALLSEFHFKIYACGQAVVQCINLALFPERLSRSIFQVTDVDFSKSTFLHRLTSKGALKWPKAC